MPYWQLLYHLVWATDHRAPLITPELEQHIYKLMRMKATELGGQVFALNGDKEHTHLVSTIPPKIAVATFVGQIKGVCSAAVNNQHLCEQPFYWQDDYGAFSFDGKRLNNYIAYVRKQKEHHAQGTTIPILERFSTEDYLIREDEPLYLVDNDDWRRELYALDRALSDTSPIGQQRVE